MKASKRGREGERKEEGEREEERERKGRKRFFLLTLMEV